MDGFLFQYAGCLLQVNMEILLEYIVVDAVYKRVKRLITLKKCCV